MPATKTYMISDDPDVEYKWSCNQIRGKLRKYIENGGAKTTEMQRELGVNSNSWGRFMRYTGSMQGCDGGVYEAATRFFLDMERRGEKMPKAKPAPAAGKENAPPAGSAAAGIVAEAGKPASKGKAKAPKPTTATADVTGVKLNGEDTDSVPVYDSCDVVRRKIEAHLKLPGVTRAAFLRDLGAQFSEKVNIQSKQLNDFLAKRGPVAGNTSRVYYAGYVFFEKRRVALDQPKNAHRLGMEKSHPGGADTSRMRTHILCRADEILVEDEFGNLH
ncbi:hypothetical protein A1Q1_04833 [Trichosporon asahii var. asahii CBS 2479]|uniref:DUF7726 domain-containing protein n=1 Tax=Trichosporon asahii var. asahii (strain ATCC 90039 / CBS 2479 / JCM 2466 / KCTC 7840 / NBRC 103889/ NCYC 2677 / UAMH 7654) TaxID=1186058 RepID=J5QBW4_TRIAS|nr:hypothetical protein A1Q1_04833 [Trichosporon asahii var. asahii CBS 2479]EJT46538.1 hypothetical protein A1Q1_04833 [Trichosporon asahii var. asahii CBS 2479]